MPSQIMTDIRQLAGPCSPDNFDTSLDLIVFHTEKEVYGEVIYWCTMIEAHSRFKS